MRALKISKITALVSLVVATSLISLGANAHCKSKHHCHWRYYTVTKVSVPTANCVAHNTALPLPAYVCCRMDYKKHHVWHNAWRNKWVEYSCKNVGAHVAFGCKTSSPVLSTGMPIMGNCQFSASTNRYR